MHQFGVLYFRSFDAPLRLTLWRDQQYVDLEAPFRRYYFGVEVKPYSAPAGPAE